MTTIVHFDKELYRLAPEDADAWRAWLSQHQLDHLSIACPSLLEYWEPTGKKPAMVTVELLNRDPQGALRSMKTVYFSDSVSPFPSGYQIATR